MARPEWPAWRAHPRPSHPGAQRARESHRGGSRLEVERHPARRRPRHRPGPGGRGPRSSGGSPPASDVALPSASTTGSPSVRFGTKWLSMTSTWSQSLGPARTGGEVGEVGRRACSERSGFPWCGDPSGRPLPPSVRDLTDGSAGTSWCDRPGRRRARERWSPADGHGATKAWLVRRACDSATATNATAHATADHPKPRPGLPSRPGWTVARSTDRADRHGQPSTPAPASPGRAHRRRRWRPSRP